MKHLVLGTAGHVDHGKTSLVKALTGVDTDRLKEEKARGITIELGFAHLELSHDLSIGIVDVPGHEKFIRTMVSGVTGMDMVMLVIAADEGVMPQTREHLDILRLLGVRQGVVVLSKSDIVSDEWLELVKEEIRVFTAGTFLENAPVVPFSARSGEGRELLESELEKLSESIAEKKAEGHFRLPVDRLFTIAGFGTVVTGTLLSGEIATGDEVEILPSGRHSKVRGIQAHGDRIARGAGGQRLAVNLQGIELNQVDRGDILVPPGVFRTTRMIDVRLDYLSSAPRLLRHRATVRLHSATYDTGAMVLLFDRESLSPGETAFARLVVERPVLLLSGDSYIIRFSSPAVTVGGGSVLDPFPPPRRRRSDETLHLLSSLDLMESRKIIELITVQGLLGGVTFEEILVRSGIPKKVAETALTALLSEGEVVQMLRDPRTFISAGAFRTLEKMLLDEVTGAARKNPEKNSISKEELKTRIPERSNSRFFTPLLFALEKDGVIAVERDIVRPAGEFAIAPAVQERALDRLILSILQKTGMEPPQVKELADRCGKDEKTVRSVLDSMARRGETVRVSGELYYAPEAVCDLQGKLIACLEANREVSPALFRDYTGLSRKYLIPLLEYFDSEKLTIRVGEKRVARRKTGL